MNLKLLMMIVITKKIKLNSFLPQITDNSDDNDNFFQSEENTSEYE
jgi:hypothetical protein